MHKRTPAEIRSLVSITPDKLRDRFPLSGHHLHFYLNLVSHLGANAAPLPPQIGIDLNEREQFRLKHSIPADRTIVGINPGAEYGPAKRWPVECFIEAASKVETSSACTWVITGGAGDVPLCNQIAEGLRQKNPSSRIYNLCGRTTLRELCLALSLCATFLTNDTGPMHLAAAVGAKVFGLFGSTSPELTGPGLPGDDRHRLILGQAACAPCFLRECPIDFRCMHSITPELINSEIVKILSEPKAIP